MSEDEKQISEPVAEESVVEEPVAAEPAMEEPPSKADIVKAKRKETNRKYYDKVRQKLKTAEAPPVVQPPEEPKTPKKTKAKAKPRAMSPKKRPPPSPPESPRTRMAAAYREARLQDAQRKQERYRSWFE
jgi:hypothetical protein